MVSRPSWYENVSKYFSLLEHLPLMTYWLISMVCTRPIWVDSLPISFIPVLCLCSQLIDLNVCTRLVWMLRNIFDTKKRTFSWVLHWPTICTFLAQIVELGFLCKKFQMFLKPTCYLSGLLLFLVDAPITPQIWRYPTDSQCSSHYLKNGLYQCKDILICLGSH